MKPLATVMAVLIGILLIGSISVTAHDFNQLLNAVEKIELNLKQLVEQEAQARSQELAKIRLELKGVTSSRPDVTQADMGSIMAELEYLRQEVGLWKSFFEQNQAALASLEDGAIPVQNNDNEIRELSERLTALSATIDQVAASSPANAPSPPTQAQPSESKTTIDGTVYSHGMFDFSDNSDNYNEFAVSRAYVTLKSKLSDYASLRITSDMRPIDDKYNIILKYAYLDWKPGFSHGYTTIRFGLQPTQYIDQMNKLWDRRYVEKTIGDQRSFLTSSDLGVSSIVGFGSKAKYGFASLALMNGTSYSSVQELNSSKDLNFFSVVKPFKQLPAFFKSALMIQYYTGAQNKSLDDIVTVDTTLSPWDSTVTPVGSSNWKRQIISVGGLLAWNSTVDVGFDLNFTTVGQGLERMWSRNVACRSLALFT